MPKHNHNHIFKDIQAAIEEDKENFPELQLDKRHLIEAGEKAVTKPSFDLEEVAMALIHGKGFLSRASEVLNCSEGTVSIYVKKYPSMALAREIAREVAKNQIQEDIFDIATMNVDLEDNWNKHYHQRAKVKVEAGRELLRSWFASETKFEKVTRQIDEKISREVEEEKKEVEKPLGLRFADEIEDAEVIEDSGEQDEGNDGEN